VEIDEAFAEYEKALVDNDLFALTEAFWASPDVVRFGIADHQVGAEQLRAWREAQAPLPPGRTLFDTRIVAFGPDVAVVTTRFHYPGRAAEGRQSQTWIRLPAGWRIVHAHVSEIED
jgi:ketosteroid isomerase-like protein